MAWEGHTVKIADPEEKRRAVEQAVGLLTRSAALCREAGLPVDIVSCGGTGTYSITAGLPGVTEVQAGGGAFCDVYYREHMARRSRVRAHRARDRDQPPHADPDHLRRGQEGDEQRRGDAPAAHRGPGRGRWRSPPSTARIDLAEPNTTLRVGDKLEFVVGYSDTTVCLHDDLYGVRDGRVEVIWPILGRGKLR